MGTTLPQVGREDSVVLSQLFKSSRGNGWFGTKVMLCATAVFPTVAAQEILVQR